MLVIMSAIIIILILFLLILLKTLQGINEKNLVKYRCLIFVYVLACKCKESHVYEVGSPWPALPGEGMIGGTRYPPSHESISSFQNMNIASAENEDASSATRSTIVSSFRDDISLNCKLNFLILVVIVYNLQKACFFFLQYHIAILTLFLKSWTFLVTYHRFNHEFLTFKIPCKS